MDDHLITTKIDIRLLAQNPKHDWEFNRDDKSWIKFKPNRLHPLAMNI